MNSLLSLLVGFFFISSVGFANEPWIDSDLEADIRATMDIFKVPGLAVGVVDLKNQRTYLKGFGWRNIERQLPVTENTLFMIGSTTKAFTATGIAKLVEDKKLRWEQPVREILPEFELKDPVATQLATVVDLMSHRTGLPRHDLVWYGDDSSSRAQYLSILKYLDPSATFREKFQYNNLMFLVAGMVSEKLTGLNWEEYTRRTIFRPLGMNQSNFSIEDMQASPDFATPYSLDEEKVVKEVPFHPIRALGPAGSIHSSVRDLIEWLKFNLRPQDYPQLLNEKSLAVVHTPVVALGSRPHPEYSHSQYALGWGVGQFRGRTWLWHGGGIDGFITHVGFMPDQQLGVVVVANSDRSNTPEVVALKIYDHLLKAPKTNWVERHLKAQPPETPEPIPTGSPLPRPAFDYVGQYSHPAYGEITVAENQGHLRLNFRHRDFDLVHIKQGAFVARNDKLGLLSVVFQVNESGELKGLELGAKAFLSGQLTFKKTSNGVTAVDFP